MSCRRGDSDFTLQEGGNGTLPPPMPTYDGRRKKSTVSFLTIVFMCLWGVPGGIFSLPTSPINLAP